MSVKNYREQAESDAWDTLSEFVDQMCEQWRSDTDCDISSDLNNDYPNGDEYHHENHVGKWYNLTEAATVLDQLDDFEETDTGLWEGQDPRRAIGTQAAYTYGNAVYSLWDDKVTELNAKLTDLKDSITESLTEEGRDEDAIEEAVKDAGERYIRLWVLLGEKGRGDFEGLVGAALDSAEDGDATTALVLADKVQESEGGSESLAKQIREAAGAK